MAATVQSNPYLSVSRKIGYSVGLEYLLARVTRLVDGYVETGGISLAEWRRIVEDEFGRRGAVGKGATSPYEHIANFLSALNFIKIQGRALIVLPNLDSCAIVRRLVVEESEAQKGILSICLFSVLEADGDIFTNLLAAGFEKEACRSNLIEMISAKWACYSKAVTSGAGLDRIWEAVSIRSQLGRPTNFGQTMAGGTKRTVSLTESLKRPILSPSKVPEVLDSYLEGVITTRRGWARDLGLVNESVRTERATRVLDFLRQHGFALPKGGMAVWPYDFEVAQVRLHGRAPVKVDSWDLLKAVDAAFSSQGKLKSLDREPLFDLVVAIYEAYRVSNRAMGMIRNQLPMYVLKPSLAAICIARGEELPNLTEFLDVEARDPRRRINRISIRGTEGAITIKV